MFAYMRKLQEARRRDDGASAVEYGLLIAAIAALIVIAVFGVGTLVKGAFSETCSALSDDTAGPVSDVDADCDVAP